MLFCTFAVTLLLGISELAHATDLSNPSGVIHFSKDNEPTILTDPIKTHMMLLADTEAEYWPSVKASFEEMATQDTTVLYIVVPMQTEAAAAKKFFHKVDYHPAVLIANRKTGEYARPFAAFSSSELGSIAPTLTKFRDNFVSHYKR
jgi:hypothetical protein